MKKVLAIILTIITTLTAIAQDRSLFSKKENLKDFIGKTTKVVIDENGSLLDMIIKDAVTKNWYLSPYEFCTKQDFETFKTDTNYYFLMKVNGSLNKDIEPAMEFLSLLKGGPEAAKGISEMYEIISIPLQGVNDNQGRVFTFIPAFINIVQSHVLKVNRSILSAYVGISSYSNTLDDAKNKTILFSEDDFAIEINSSKLEDDFKGRARFASEKEIDKALDEREPNTLVSIVIAPTVNQRGSYCYKMLISTDTQELFLYRKHKITTHNKRGYTKEDYRKMTTPFMFSK